MLPASRASEDLGGWCCYPRFSHHVIASIASKMVTTGFFYNCSKFFQELHKITRGMTSPHQLTLPEETESETTELALARHLMLWWESRPSTRMKEPAASVRNHEVKMGGDRNLHRFVLTFGSKGFFWEHRGSDTDFFIQL